MNNRSGEFENKILEYALRFSLLNQGDRVIVGLSGGADSVCLLRVLCALRGKLDLKLYGVHVNHMLRGDNAFRDEEFAKNICEQNGIEFFVKRADVNKIAKERKQSTELAARNVRYEYFFEMKEKLAADKIAVAHNKNDQAETSLMHYLRGSGIDGLRGIVPKRDDGVIRPLLCVTRAEIEEYLELLSQNYVTDATNFEQDYTRNKVRLSLIPYLEENFNPNICDVISRNAYNLYEDAMYLQNASDEAYKSVVSYTGGNIVILSDEYKKQPTAISMRILKSVIRSLCGDDSDIDAVLLRRLDDFCKTAGTGKTAGVYGGVYAVMEYGKVRFLRTPPEIADFCYELKIGEPIFVKEADAWFSAELTDSLKKETKYETYFDYNTIKGKLYIRNRRAGDRFSPYNMKGTKKLKDFFIDEKIPVLKRDSVCLVTDEEDILWVASIRRSDSHKITKETKQFLKIQMRGEL